MISEPLTAALADLSTTRIQRLVDAIESDATIKLTVRAWSPNCPMVAAGFDPCDGFVLDCPERRFAAAWDRFAKPEPRYRWAPVFFPLVRSARRSDVQALLRAANEVLAARQERTDAHRLDPNGLSLPGLPHRVWTDGRSD